MSFDDLRHRGVAGRHYVSFMRTFIRGFALSLLAASLVGAAPAGNDVARVVSWLVGSFDTRAQAEADRRADTADKHDVALMVVRPVDDPVVFQDGLYVYVENRIEGETKPYRQRVYRLKKIKDRIRLEVFKIDTQVLELLVLAPQMLASLSPRDLTREEGCDVLLEPQGEEYSGSTPRSSCKSDWKGSSFVTSTMRVTKDLIVTLDRGYDEKEVQTFGPTDGRGCEFRRGGVRPPGPGA